MANTPDWNQAPRVPERGPTDSATFADEVLAAGSPVVLRGQVADWPLVEAGRGSSEAFSQALLAGSPGGKVNYFEGAAPMGGRFFYSDDLQGFNFDRCEAPFADFLAQLCALEQGGPARHLYAGAVRVPETAPALLEGHDHGLLPPDQEQLVSLWIGNASRTAAHFDLPQNLACVLRGPRRFIVLPTDALPDLYLGPLDRTLAGQPVSLVDFLAPDFEAHPRAEAALARAQVADLEPGDALYLPSMWFHHVESSAPLGAMMNFWWRDAPDYMFTPMITLMHSLLSLRALPEQERMAWRTLFDHYIFQVNGDSMEHVPEPARGMFGDLTPEKIQRLRYYLAKSLS